MKSIFRSKTFWLNLVAIAGIVYQGVTGKVLFTIEGQATVLAFINIVLRLITKEPVVWK